MAYAGFLFLSAAQAMFREGRAATGIARLREDGRATLVRGGRQHAIEAIADFWQARHAANAGVESYSLTVSAPTNRDARDISAAIRERRRAAGALGPDVRVIRASDQGGAEYDLPLAVGDRVRLFQRTAASFGGKGGTIGVNGSVVTVERVADEGLQLRNAKGSSGFVKWSSLRDRETGKLKLSSATGMPSPCRRSRGKPVPRAWLPWCPARARRTPSAATSGRAGRAERHT